MLAEVLDETRLAHARFAVDENDDGRPGASLLQGFVERLELGGPAGTEGALRVWWDTGTPGDDVDGEEDTLTACGSSIRSTSAAVGRVAGSERSSLVHSASRSGGTPGATSRAGTGTFCCLSIRIVSGGPSNGSTPVSAS